LIAVAGPLFSAGCKSKSKSKKEKAPPPPQLSGLQAVPSDATAILGFDVAKLAKSKLVRRAVEQMFIRDPGLRSHTSGLLKACKIEPTRDVASLLIALRGSTDALMVATGRLDGAALATCVNESMKTGGGTLTNKKVGGRTVYRARRGERDVWFAVAGTGTVVVSTSEAWLGAALSSGPKLLANADMKRLVDEVDRTKSGAWAAGKVPPAVSAGMVKTTAGTVSAGPKALTGQLDLDQGLKGSLGAEMASREDANALELFLKAQLGAGAALIGGLRLGPLLRKVTVDSKGSKVYLRVSLSAAELEQALGQIDSGGSPVKNSPPK
jgi:hypothetical protein